MFKKVGSISVNGYRPFNGLNIFLSLICGLTVVAAISTIAQGVSGVGLLAVLAAIVFFALILFRNRKVNSIPKMIEYSLFSVFLGICTVILFFLWALDAGMAQMNGRSAPGLFDFFREHFGSGSTSSTSQESSGSKWTKQYSNSKGEYSTDGQGNFKDQYGNDVYNPQGVTDYNKL